MVHAFGGGGRGSAHTMPRFAPRSRLSRHQHLDLQRRDPVASGAENQSPSHKGGPASDALGWQETPIKPQELPSIFPPRQLPRCPMSRSCSALCTSQPDPALAEGAATPVPRPAPTRRSQAKNTPSTHPGGIPGCPTPALGQVAPKLLSLQKLDPPGHHSHPTEDAAAAQPEFCWGRGAEGEVARESWILSQEEVEVLDLLPVSRAGSPPSLWGLPSSFFTTTLQQPPQVCVIPLRLSGMEVKFR